MKTQPHSQSPKQARSTKTRRRATPRRLRDPEMLTLMFQAFEDLTTLREHCVGKIQAARNFEYVCRKMPLEPDQSGLQRWLQISERVIACRRVVDDLLRTHRLDADRCYESYRGLLGIRPTWRQLQHSSDARVLVEQVTTHLRQVLIHHAQQQHYRG